ncbi:1,4-alpha-glucan branching protein GlgB [Mobilibacterium timonense]|uniref:1,4-alpha-glucan branching protein GlgB n=1 Tax=Mobilibacterium timonense TaxID=1871012 RepID=UPI0009841B9A|nr:1,4-alpha-glucan branching protein GlgB [Mobilibacterium timonense]
MQKKTAIAKDDNSQHRYLFHKGRDYRAYEYFGAHRTAADGKEGFVFRVWAPRAVEVSLVGSFNEWDLEKGKMHTLETDSSIYELFSPDAALGDLYKFAITSDDGKTVYKADPYGFASEKDVDGQLNMRASVVRDISEPFEWHDEQWIEKRDSSNPYESPMNIYEVHLGSWRRHEDGSYLSYEELADQLIPYVHHMGYTHIELLPVMEHPFDGSWGYQVTGYYSVTSRYGDADGFRILVDRAHEAGIGVILDWVPAHFPKDEFGLINFDGHPLYEYTDPLKMEHKGWGTRAFDFGRPEVVSFLISNAFYYCDCFHADGLRVDAVAAMLYLNYDRADGEWTPNDEGGVENKEAIAFFQNLNQDILTNHKGVVMIAEESTAWPNVTKPPSVGGLGFNFKWNMGWMNDVLDYFQTDPLFRKGVHNKLTFAITYAYSENYILPVSHDEVVHGKKSLLDKMPGEYEDKFKGLKSFLVYMYTHPGKKLTFMGTEIAQFTEWNEEKELDWMLLDYETHRSVREFVRVLNHYYLNTPALWKTDDDFNGFNWIDADNASDNVYTYFRILGEVQEKKEKSHEKKKKGEKGADRRDVVLTALNLSGKGFEEYDIGVPDGRGYQIVVNTETDGEEDPAASEKNKMFYPVKPGAVNGYEQHITVKLPALSAVILERIV